MTSIDSAVAEWRSLLGETSVLASDDRIARYHANTCGLSRTIPAVIRPQSTQQVVAAVQVASRHRVPLYPVSTGRNWGYGCALPVTDGCTVLDLSGMNRILSLDTDLDAVTVQPGVTQGDLHRYCVEHHLDYMVPTTGAGPNVSLMGNALERGYGLTPHADHFLALISLEAVLPDGRVYRSALRECSSPAISRCYKWGIGPYLDGLFSQGAFGIVTEATIRLAWRPECVEEFFIPFHEDSDLEKAVETVRQLQRVLGANLSAMNLMSRARMLAMSGGRPPGLRNPGSQSAATEPQIGGGPTSSPAWCCVGAMYGTPRMVRAVRSTLKSIAAAASARPQFLSSGRVAFLRRLASMLPEAWANRIRERLTVLGPALDMFRGIPAEIGLNLAYSRTSAPAKNGSFRNPSTDGVGLIWFSPLVPMLPAAARQAVTTIREICPKHGFEPVITFSTVADGCFDSTVPLLFDVADAGQRSQAEACYAELLTSAAARGFQPYRVGVGQMPLAVRPELSSWNLTDKIRRCIDPLGILLPGRYSSFARMSAIAGQEASASKAPYTPVVSATEP